MPRRISVCLLIIFTLVFAVHSFSAEPEKGKGNFGNFHHEDWWAGTKGLRTQLREFGTLWIRTKPDAR